MLFTVIKKNSYQDSINLMLLTKQLSGMEGVKKVSIMMGTPANLDIMKNSGLYTPDLDEATPADICVVVDSDAENTVDTVMNEVEHFILNQATAAKSDRTLVARSWDSVMKKMPDANWALISIAGEYAAKEADKALDRGLSVMLFSDNVSVPDEFALKKKAAEKGLLVMGPDCGTAIISGVPLAFANTLEKGNIGIIGASGTGIQEVAALISRSGCGCSQVIGLGGRDLTAGIGGIMALKSIELLAEDDETDIIVFISKPPAPEVREKVMKKLSAQNKPVVAIFLGEKPTSEANIHYARTLDETARLAVSLAKSTRKLPQDELNLIRSNPEQRGIMGLYSGGTLAAEAGMILSHSMGLSLDAEHPAGIMFEHGDYKVIDLGDDVYTRGKPHPMIDPSLRLEMMRQTAYETNTAVILMDFVIGYGSFNDVAGTFAPEIQKILETLKQEDKSIFFVASVTGTQGDPDPYEQQTKMLEDAGVYVLDSNATAVEFALSIIRQLEQPALDNRTTSASGIHESSAIDTHEQPALDNHITSTTGVRESSAMDTNEQPALGNQEPRNRNSIWDKPRVANVGIKHFASPIQQHGGKVLQFQWNPPAAGDSDLASLLERLYDV